MKPSGASIAFLTFGAGSSWPEAAYRLAKQAEAAAIFDHIILETEHTIFGRHPDFERHRPFIAANPRGWGYWVWKPFLVLKYLNALNEGDLLVYLDAGCEILPENNLAFIPILEHAFENGAALFDYASMPIFNLAFWTKPDALDHFQKKHGLADPHRVPTFWAGGFVLQKNSENMRLVQDWLATCCVQNYHLVDDTPSITEQKYFVCDHRHDQSILSALASIAETSSFGTAFEFDLQNLSPEYLSIAIQKPFLAYRNRFGHSMLEHHKCFPKPKGQTTSSLFRAYELTDGLHDYLHSLGLA